MADSDNVLDGDETFECPQCGIMYRGSYKIGIGIARGCSIAGGQGAFRMKL